MGITDIVADEIPKEAQVHHKPTALFMNQVGRTKHTEEPRDPEEGARLAKQHEEFLQRIKDEADSAPLDSDTAYKLAQKEFVKRDTLKDFIRGMIGKHG